MDEKNGSRINLFEDSKLANEPRSIIHIFADPKLYTERQENHAGGVNYNETTGGFFSL